MMEMVARALSSAAGHLRDGASPRCCGRIPRSCKLSDSKFEEMLFEMEKQASRPEALEREVSLWSRIRRTNTVINQNVA